MKTLLLSLGVVVFMCLDSGYTTRCNSCTGGLCMTFANCPDGQFCFRRQNMSGILGLDVVKGCTDTCATPGEDERVMYCTYDMCNW